MDKSPQTPKLFICRWADLFTKTVSQRTRIGCPFARVNVCLSQHNQQSTRLDGLVRTYSIRSQTLFAESRNAPGRSVDGWVQAMRKYVGFVQLSAATPEYLRGT